MSLKGLRYGANAKVIKTLPGVSDKPREAYVGKTGKIVGFYELFNNEVSVQLRIGSDVRDFYAEELEVIPDPDVKIPYQPKTYQGFQGWQGTPDPEGLAGSAGPVGFQGWQGVVGLPGSLGSDDNNIDDYDGDDPSDVEVVGDWLVKKKPKPKESKKPTVHKPGELGDRKIEV